MDSFGSGLLFKEEFVRATSTTNSINDDMVGNGLPSMVSQNDSESALSNYEAYTIDCDWLSLFRDAEVFAIIRNSSKGSGRAS